MNYDLLNEMITYIENHLDQKVDYNRLSKIVGIHEYTLQRIFIFVTGLSISEYIRKRRLSKALEDLKNTNDKIIDIAIKYQYNNASSFTRAFKNEYGITPTQCRESTEPYKLFSKFIFKKEEYHNELNYQIKWMDEQTIYCVKISSSNHDESLFNIKKLYSNIHNTKFYQFINEDKMIALSYHDQLGYHYCVGSINPYKHTEIEIFPKGRYAIFEVGSRKQKDIIKINQMIYRQWLPSTDYKIKSNYNIEIYRENNCYIYVPLKD